MNWSVITLGFTTILAIVGSGLDNWTTYIALTEFADGAREANLLAATAFHAFGLGTSLTVGFLLGVVAVFYLAQTRRIKRNSTRSWILGLLGAARAGAAANNWYVITTLGA